MRANELIVELQRMIEAHGDLDVLFCDYSDYSYRDIKEVAVDTADELPCFVVE